MDDDFNATNFAFWPVGDGQFQRTCQLSLRDPELTSVTVCFAALDSRLPPTYT